MTTRSGDRDDAVVSARSMSDVPPTRCSTFGTADFIRVPLPAASNTRWIGTDGKFGELRKMGGQADLNDSRRWSRLSAPATGTRASAVANRLSSIAGPGFAQNAGGRPWAGAAPRAPSETSRRPAMVRGPDRVWRDSDFPG